jgi:alkaline phosphatase D
VSPHALSWLEALAVLLVVGAGGCGDPKPARRSRDAGAGKQPDAAMRVDAATRIDAATQVHAGGARCVLNAELDEDGGVPGAPSLSMQPMLGAVAAESMRIWLRSDAPADSCIEYWPLADPGARASLMGPRLAAEHDFTGAITLRGLSPSTRYGYRVLLAPPGGEHALQTVDSASFRTSVAAGTPARLRLVIGADIAGGGAHPVFDQIREQAPDALLLLGDLAYTDQLEPTVEAYRSKLRSNWGGPTLSRLVASVPTFAIWDDHDIAEDFWPGKSIAFDPARTAFVEYVASRNPDPPVAGALYFSFTFGDIEVFVLDVRSARSPNFATDDRDKTMLGAAQREHLLAWLQSSTATLKVIASPVLFVEHATTGNDAWQGFLTERNQIFDFIASQGIDNVLLLSGDQHWSGLFKLEHNAAARRYRFYEFQATPLSKEAASAPLIEGDDVLAVVGDLLVFGVVDIDTRASPATIDFTLCVADQPCSPPHEAAPSPGHAPFSFHLTSDELGVPP